MPNVYNVSEITNILSGIIKNEDTLQDISVTGKVSVDNRPDVFFLSYEEKKIRCFIPGGNLDQFGSLLTAENTVVVHGRISLFPRVSEYQIRIDNIQSVRIDETGNDSLFTVSDITRKLEQTLAKSSHELAEVHVRGEISELARQSEATLWFLKETIWQQIHCVDFDDDLIQDSISVTNGNQIRIKGKIQIWGAQSRYQINVTDIKPNNSTEQCQCSGCDQCGNARQCDRPREVANFESCARCLPRPPDELYKLCPKCYAMSPNHETKVADAVYAYFHELQVNGFSPYKGYQIQFGTRNGIPDVVLADGNGSFAVIAECKGAGYVGHGIEQLKSYLSATDTRFGVFANRVDKSQWKFYENRQGNCIPEIDCSESQFKARVVERVANHERLRDEIANLNGEIEGLENQKSELHTAIEQVSQTKHNLTERTSNLTQQIEALENYKSELHEEIHRKLEELLEEKMQKLESPLSDLKIELQKRGIVNWFKNLFSKENK